MKKIKGKAPTRAIRKNIFEKLLQNGKIRDILYYSKNTVYEKESGKSPLSVFVNRTNTKSEVRYE